MRSSPWTILVLGVLAFAMIAVGMLLTLGRFRSTPAGNRLKLANEIREKFRFDSVRVDRGKEGKHETIFVQYETEVPLYGDTAAMEKEMRDVGILVFEKCEPKDKEEVDRVHVTRHEVRRSGCDRKVLSHEVTVKNPELEKFFE